MMTLNELANFKTIPFSELENKYSFSSCTNGDWDIEDLFGEEPEEVFYYKGDIHITGNVLIEGNDEHSYFFIDGNLIIDGTFSINIDDIYNVLGILGKLNAKNLLLSYQAFLFVQKEVKITNTMFTTIGDEAACYFNDKATVKMVILKDVDPDIFSTDNFTGKVIDAAEMLNDYEELEFEEILELILKGEKLV